MSIDPFDPGTSVAQEFPTQEPDKLRRLWQIIAAQKRAMFDLRASVLANVSDIVADLQAQVAATAAATAAVAAAQITLTAQGVTLTATVATLTAQQATLTAQQATLTAQQATLTAAVANIATLVGQQVTGDAGSATTGGAAGLGTSASSFAVITFNVPAGYTVAAVNANTAAAVSTPIYGTIATRIAGIDGPFMNAYANSSGLANGASNFSRVFGVTPGGTFTVETRAFSPSAGSSALLTTAAGVTFYR